MRDRPRTSLTKYPPLGWLRRSLGRFVPDEVWYNWRWDLLAGIFSGVYQGAIWTFALQLARGKLHATGNEMALATAAPAIGFLFATFWARQMEGRSKLPFVTLTWLISRGLFAFTPLLVQGAHSTALFVGLICATPILFSVSTPAYTAIMKEIYPDALRGRLMSYIRIGMAGAMLLSSRVMGLLQESATFHLDYRWMFAIGGVFGIGTAVAFQQLHLPPTDSTAVPPPMHHFLRDTFRILIHNKGFRWFTTSVFIAGFGNIVANTYYPIYQVDVFHIRPTQIATMQNVSSLLMLFSLFFWGWYMDRFGSLPTVLFACLILCITPLCYALGNRIEWLYVGAAAGGIATSGIELGYLNTTLMFAEPGRAAQYQALHSSFFGLRGTIAPLLAIPLLLGISHVDVMKHLSVANWRLGFEICLVIMLLGGACQYLSQLAFRLKRSREEDSE